MRLLINAGLLFGRWLPVESAAEDDVQLAFAASSAGLDAFHMAHIIQGEGCT